MTSITERLNALADLTSATCNIDLANPWSELTIPSNGNDYGPGGSQDDIPPVPIPIQQPLPDKYQQATFEQLSSWIKQAKAKLGDRVVILGHSYQRDEIVEHADYVGDSFQLARAAQKHPEAEVIIFCGVHFMAETAAVLAQKHQRVVLPNLAAGCSMADMANLPQVQATWDVLLEYLDEPPIPVTYMNSAANLKDFCGRNGGIVCTSSNADVVLKWAFSQGKRVLFFPDQHLGRNTGYAMGIKADQMILWQRGKQLGGNDLDKIYNSKIILWDGYCSVHQRFTKTQIAAARQRYSNCRVIVHPECCAEVVQAADESGSTAYITKVVEQAKPGDVLAIGTEVNLVNRLAYSRPDCTIFCLDPIICPCSTMYRVHPAHLCYALEQLIERNIINEIKVSDSVSQGAKIALERMLAARPAI